VSLFRIQNRSGGRRNGEAVNFLLLNFVFVPILTGGCAGPGKPRIIGQERIVKSSPPRETRLDIHTNIYSGGHLLF
jgi:hypothetical protein